MSVFQDFKYTMLSIPVVLLVVVGIGFGVMNATHTDRKTGCVVTEKDRTKGTDNKSDARVYTKNCGTFKVADSILEGTWTSADTYASIRVGKTYDFKTRGYRVGFFSMFPNIVRAEEVG